MKFMPSQLAFFLQSRSARRNVRSLLRFLALLGVLIIVYSVLFHILMRAEGQEHSWVTGLYWVMTVMTTLGFGDITFQSDAGRLFSIVVLVSGVMFLLVVLPFTFIQFFYAPWLETQSRLRAPRQLPEETRGHVILTHYDPVSVSLIERLVSYGRPYVVLEGRVERALALHDEGVRVMVGDPDNVESYRRLRAAQAALIVASGDDYLNTNITFTVREKTERAPVVALARAPESVDILELAGASHVLQLADMLGRSLARRALGGEARAGVVGRFDGLVIAEAPVMGTPLVGTTLAENRLREATGMTVVGVWERGRFELPRADAQLDNSTVLVLAGTAEQLESFDALVAIYNVSEAPVLILGGGRVGRAAAKALEEREIPYRIVEQDPARVEGDPSKYVVGSAADIGVLERAGIAEAPSTLVTTNDDATNIYLTIYCRRLRPDMQIISRATLERNISTLHRAGADFVMSYASMGANAIFNVLESDDVIMLAEGLDVFRYRIPPTLAGRSLAETGIREATGCSVVAFETGGRTIISPDPRAPLPADAELILIGTTEGEHAFVREFGRVKGEG
jgi:Trk K+ transport system NAD-binding subunit